MNHENDIVVGTLRIRFAVRGAQSLKEKRRAVNSIRDRIRARFNASVAEIADLDVHQSAILGVAIVGNDPGYVRSALTQVVNLAAGSRHAEMITYDLEIL